MLKNWFFPRISVLKRASTLILSENPSKFVAIKIVPKIVAGIKRHQPTILYLLGNNKLSDIIFVLTNVKYILHYDIYFLQKVKIFNIRYIERMEIEIKLLQL